MNKFEEIKSYDDYWWLEYLREKSIFDVDNIKAHKDYLIKTLDESLLEIKQLRESLINAKDTIDYLKNDYPNEMWTSEEKDKWGKIANDTIANVEEILNKSKQD
jgi:hypothetical protein